MSPQAAYELCSRVAAVWIIISAVEGLVTLRDFQAGGTYDPSQITTTIGNRVRHPMFAHAAYRGVVLMGATLIARFIAGLVLLFAPAVSLPMVASWSVTTVTGLYARWRRGIGDDGSDQMLTIMSTAFALALSMSIVDGSIEIGLLFVGAQACLAYVAAGIAKLASPTWRTGLAIRGIFCTRTYGERHAASLLDRSPHVSLILCWGTIAFETLFLLAPVLPLPVLLALLTIAATFHLIIAFVMGLNGFLWVFTSTYPAIIFLNQSTRSLW